MNKKPATAPFRPSETACAVLAHSALLLPVLVQTWPIQALRLALSTPRLFPQAAEARAALVRHACREAVHPLAALTRTLCPWTRACLARCLLLEEGLPPWSDRFHDVACLPQLEATIGPWLETRIVTALPHYERRMQLPPSAARTRSPFTYQYARLHDDRVARQFVMLADAHEALCFMHAFWRAQRVASPPEQITLLECGTYDTTWRKMILDIDAPLSDLRNAGLSTDPKVLGVAVLDLAEAVARALCAHGFLARPCPFAIVSRHAPGRKCSWHITLCALADYATWRTALAAVERDAARAEHALEWGMMPFVDMATLRNSHSQYMQVWGSTKAQARDGNCFRCEGVWASATDPLFDLDEAAATPHQRLLYESATSLNLNDPWSVPFVGLEEASALDAGERVLKRRAPPPPPPAFERPKASPRPQPAPSSSHHLASWAGLPPSAAWMKAFVDDGGTTRLHYIPSMANPAYVPDTVTKARAVWVHAQVSRYACCPRLLMGKDGFIHQHTNTGMMYCFEDAHGHARLWIRCFSAKCLANARPDRQRERGWTEVLESDLDAFRARRNGTPVPPPPPPPQPQPPPPVDWTGIPGSQAAWLRAPWDGVALTPAPERPYVPKSIFQRNTRVLVHAGVAADGLLCPRRLVRDRAWYWHAEDNGPEPYRILVAEQSSPKCAGRSYRLFVRCTHRDCAHITPDPREPQCPWTELTRLTLQTPVPK